MRVGIIGFGRVAQQGHVPALLELSARYTVVAVADPSPERLREARTTLGLDHDGLHDDARSLIRRPDLDMVLVAVPPAARPGIARRALSAGLHVVAEKPLATSVAAAAALVRGASESSGGLFVVHNYLFFPEVQAALDLIDSGAIGTVTHASVTMLGVEAQHDQTDWRGAPAVSGGGVLMDMMHAVYLARAFTAEPFESCTALTRPGTDDEIENLALVLVRGPTTTASISVAWGHGPGGMDIVGSSGRIAVRYRRDGTPPFAPLASVSVTDESGVPREVAVDAADPGRSFVGLWDDFARAITDGTPARARCEDGLEALRVVDAAYRSSATGRHVALNH